MSKLTRRVFLFTGTAVGAGLALGTGYLSTIDTDGLAGGDGHNGAAKLNAWVEIRPDGKIRIAVPRAEMGQGIYTGIATLIAEELEISLDAKTVIVEHPDELLPVYTNFVGALNKRPEDMSGRQFEYRRRLSFDAGRGGDGQDHAGRGGGGKVGRLARHV